MNCVAARASGWDSPGLLTQASGLKGRNFPQRVYRVSSSPPAIPHSSLSATLLLRYGSNPFPQSTLMTCIARFSPSTRTSK
jgi:hypothetical protein